MNNTFDIKRFGLLAKKDLAENWKKYTLAILLMFGVTTILFIWVSVNFYENQRMYMDTQYYNHRHLSENLFLLSMFLLLTYGCLSASWLMDPISGKIRRISYLTNPASSFEKYILRWGIQVVLFLAVYIIIFFVADFIQWLVCSVRYSELDVRSLDLSSLVTAKTPNEDTYRTAMFEWKQFFLLVSFFFFIQSLFILGSTFWQKNSFIKTFCAGFVVFLVYITVCGGLISIILDNETDSGVRNFFRVLEYGIFQDVSDDTIAYMVTAGFSGFTIVNWVLSYFRFKETEITKRI